MDQDITNSDLNPSLVEKPQESEKKSKLPILLIVLGVIELLYPVLMLNIAIQLSTLYKQLEITPNPAYRAYILIGIFILYSLVEIIYGIILRRKQKISDLTVKQKRTALALLFIGIILFCLSIPSWIGAIIYPLYTITSQF